MVREGEQERAIKGYNPRRPGRNSHHPLIAFVSDLRMIANYRLRPGSTAASTNYLSFLEETYHNYRTTETCGYFIVLAYKFFSLFRHALVNSPKKRFLKTIGYEYINTPDYFSKSKDKHILYLARSLKTRSDFQGI